MCQVGGGGGGGGEGREGEGEENSVLLVSIVVGRFSAIASVLTCLHIVMRVRWSTIEFIGAKER